MASIGFKTSLSSAQKSASSQPEGDEDDEEEKLAYAT